MIETFISSFSPSYLYAILTLFNVFAFALYGYDKLQSTRSSKGARRVPEKRLLTVALIGGSLGAMLGMRLFRHKIKKRSFLIKFFIVLLLQVLAAYLYFKSY